ncbi:response regulator transcription factor [Kitasatospora sp. NPDC091257]|uniref:response regulator transcription factor n=1 Tax=Kitasatospora sp. NPDC091257 TaxID=3364084 RepID=UPI0037FCB873
MEAGVVSYLRVRPEIQLLTADDDTAGESEQPVVNLVVAETLSEPILKTLRQLHYSSSGSSTTLLIGHIEEADLMVAASCGVRALLYRDVLTSEHLVSTIVSVANGEGAVPGDLLGRLLGQVGQLQQRVLNQHGLTIGGLTKREAEILELVAQGYDTAAIARRIGFSERTVKALLHGVVVRYGLHNRTHAVAYAIRQGLI